MKTRNEQREAKKLQANKEAKFKLNLVIFGLTLLTGAICYNAVFNGITHSNFSFVF